MQASSTRDVRVTGGGGQVAAHSGLFALGRFADGLGLGEALSAAVPASGERAPSHDRGKVLVHLLLMLAGGGEACSDIEHLRAQPVLFGQVASDSILYRLLRGLGPDALGGLWRAVAGVRSGVWERRGDVSGPGPVVLDIDSTLVEVHSENKAGAAAHFKGGFGFHPMLCATDAGETLSIRLRPGNAAANSIRDHIEVLDAAIAQLPETAAAGHRCGDDATQARRQVQLRVDAAGCSASIAGACRMRNVRFFLTARSNDDVAAAIGHSRLDAGLWQPALRAGGEPAERAQVAELTDSVDLRAWPEGTRFIARRARLHPGAQRTLFDSDLWRYRGFYTDAEGDPAELDAHMRAHARVEKTIAALKDSGLKRMPFRDFDANSAWTQLVALSHTLVRWFQQLPLAGTQLASAAPKRLRWQLWHAPARLVRSSRRWTLRLPDWWPATAQLLHACRPGAHRRPQPRTSPTGRRPTRTPRAPTPNTHAHNQPPTPHSTRRRTRHHPTRQPRHRNHTKTHTPDPLTNSHEQSGLRHQGLPQSLRMGLHVPCGVGRLGERRLAAQQLDVAGVMGLSDAFLQPLGCLHQSGVAALSGDDLRCCITARC